MEKSVTVKNLSKHFGQFKAVDDISFEVEKGEIYGFLGANGAGKTTTIRMLCGLLEPTAGMACVAGYCVSEKPEEVKKRIGYMSQKFSLYTILTVEENILFYAGLYGLETKAAEKAAVDVLEMTGLDEKRKTPVSDLPGGIRQRVSLACAIVHSPQVIFLDEPTAGVDPILRRRFWEIIGDFSRAGVTVFVTTHYMDEVEHCHRVALMNEGKIIKEGTIEEIKKSTFTKPVFEVETDDVVKAYNAVMPDKNEIGEISMHGAMLHFIAAGEPERARQAVENALRKSGVGFGRVSVVEPTMEDVFVKLIR